MAGFLVLPALFKLFLLYFSAINDHAHAPGRSHARTPCLSHGPGHGSATAVSHVLILACHEVARGSG